MFRNLHGINPPVTVEDRDLSAIAASGTLPLRGLTRAYAPEAAGAAWTAAMPGIVSVRFGQAIGSFLLFGPYAAYGAGRYQCAILLRAEPADHLPEQPVLAFDTALDQVERHDAQPVTWSALTPGRFQALYFCVDVPRPVGALETRLKLLAPLGLVLVAAVALRRLPGGSTPGLSTGAAGDV